VDGMPRVLAANAVTCSIFFSRDSSGKRLSDPCVNSAFTHRADGYAELDQTHRFVIKRPNASGLTDFLPGFGQLRIPLYKRFICLRWFWISFHFRAPIFVRRLV
jgi:hypothetical protein